MAINILGVTQVTLPTQQLLVVKPLLYVMRDYPSSWLLNLTHRLDIIQVHACFELLILLQFYQGSISFDGKSD
jgi:hypothetical protein